MACDCTLTRVVTCDRAIVGLGVIWTPKPTIAGWNRFHARARRRSHPRSPQCWPLTFAGARHHAGGGHRRSPAPAITPAEVTDIRRRPPSCSRSSLPHGPPLRVEAPLLRGRLGQRLAPRPVALREAELRRAQPALPRGRERLRAVLAPAEVVGDGVPRGDERAAAARGDPGERRRATGPAGRSGARRGSAAARPGRAGRRAPPVTRAASSGRRVAQAAAQVARGARLEAQRRRRLRPQLAQRHVRVADGARDRGRAARRRGSAAATRRARTSATAPRAAAAGRPASASGPAAAAPAAHASPPAAPSPSRPRCPSASGGGCSAGAGGHRRAPVPRVQHERLDLVPLVGRADPPALARGVAVGGARDHRPRDPAEVVGRRRRERRQVGMDVADARLERPVVGRRVEVAVLADEARVVGGALRVARRDADDVPVRRDLLRVGGIQPQRAPAHLAHRHAGGRARQVDQAVHARRVPALAEERARADERARRARREDGGRQPDPAPRSPLARPAQLGQPIAGRLGAPARPPPPCPRSSAVRPAAGHAVARRVGPPPPASGRQQRGASSSAHRSPRPDTSSGRRTAVRASPASARDRRARGARVRVEHAAQLAVRARARQLGVAQDERAQVGAARLGLGAEHLHERERLGGRAGEQPVDVRRRAPDPRARQGVAEVAQGRGDRLAARRRRGLRAARRGSAAPSPRAARPSRRGRAGGGRPRRAARPGGSGSPAEPRKRTPAAASAGWRRWKSLHGTSASSSPARVRCRSRVITHCPRSSGPSSSRRRAGP